MRLWLARAAVLAGLLALAGVLRHFLAPMGLAWVVYAGLAVVLVVFGGELVLRVFRRRRERADWGRWRSAIVEPALRPAAIRELTEALEAARRLGGRTRLRQARLAIALAEISLGAGDSEAATETLARLHVGRLDPGPAALVRLARAQAYLHRDDAEGARATLSAVDSPIGDPVLDATAELTRAALALVEGAPERAAEGAEAVRARAHEGDDLYAEACVLAAAAGLEGAAGDLAGLPDATRRRALALACGAARERIA